MKVWYKNKGDTTPTIILPESFERPGELFFSADCESNVDKYKIVWMNDEPSIVLRSEYTSEKLEKEREDAWEKVKAEREKRGSGGIKVGNYWFHSDESSRIQHLGLVVAAMIALQNGGTLQTIISPTPWKTMSGEKVPLTVSLIFNIFQAGLIFTSTIFSVAEQHKAIISIHHKPLEYDYTTGWPESYGV